MLWVEFYVFFNYRTFACNNKIEVNELACIKYPEKYFPVYGER
jgi:hypothetical protein